jgi:hypothetical protein
MKGSAFKKFRKIFCEAIVSSIRNILLRKVKAFCEDDLLPLILMLFL